MIAQVLAGTVLLVWLTGTVLLHKESPSRGKSFDLGDVALSVGASLLCTAALSAVIAIFMALVATALGCM